MAIEQKPLKLSFKPLVPQRWAEFTELFGSRGACGGCWCMWWRRKRSEFTKHKGAGNRRAMKRLVDSGHKPGIIAYHRGQPVGWCSLAPREQFPVLANSRVLKPVDDKPVWSVVCFFVVRAYRRQGVARMLLDAAARYAAKNGARIVEGYPVQPRKKPMPDAFAWVGPAALFDACGFSEVARRSPTRPIMRLDVLPSR